MRWACRWFRETKASEEDGPDADLVSVFGIGWIASIVRVAGALMHHETFGAEQTLALFCVFLLSWLLLKPFVTLARPGQRASVPETEPIHPKVSQVRSRSHDACDERGGPHS